MRAVSIIVPFYNVEDYLERCIQSLINQTLEDIEIILVNDGSQDGSEEIALQYKNLYPDKIIYIRKPNGGLSDARNFGIHYATGEYIAFLDSDDYVEEEMYEEMYKSAKMDRADVVECDFIWQYPEETIVSHGRSYKDRKDMLLNARVVAWNKLYRRNLIMYTENKFPVGMQYEDVEFFYKLVPFINSISIVKKPFIHYVQRDNSISNVQNERTAEIITVLDNVIKFYKEKGFYENYASELEYLYARYLLCSSFLRMVMIPEEETRTKIINLAWNSLNTNFPSWKKNKYLQVKSRKNAYMKTVTEKRLKFYTKIFRINFVRNKIQKSFI